MNPKLITALVVIIIAAIAATTYAIIKYIPDRRKQKLRQKIFMLADHKATYEPEDFHIHSFVDYRPIERPFAGVYIIHNRTKGKYYVGKSRRVIRDLEHHFPSQETFIPTPNAYKINQEIYDGYRNKDAFEIQMIEFGHSRFKSLDELAQAAIEAYDADTTSCQ